ncbi:MAG: NPCBM/NEW2 domain-containing protein [Oscillospiraceae bacterium]|nr:NPCBM/NEW2 domain-containing protein [Oscillospiraceae bacterium]
MTKKRNSVALSADHETNSENMTIAKLDTRTKIIVAIISAAALIISALIGIGFGKNTAKVIKVELSGTTTTFDVSQIVELTEKNAALKTENAALQKQVDDILLNSGDTAALATQNDSLQETVVQQSAQINSLETELETYRSANLFLTRKQEAKESSTVFANQNKYIEAIESLTRALSELSADAELSALRDGYVSKFIETEIARANAQAENAEYDGALKALRDADSKLKTALAVTANNSQLSAAITRIALERGVSLTDPTIAAKLWTSYRWTYGETGEGLANASGTIYKAEALLNWVMPSVEGGYNSGYGKAAANAEYRLDGKYSRLTGVIEPHQYCSEGAIVVVTVYVDNVVMWESPRITRRSSAVPISVDITGGEYVKITVRNDEYQNIGGKILIMDLALH